ncbi:MAG: hypothetical protein U0841_12860 [Chloroflexia bacterium]
MPGNQVAIGQAVQFDVPDAVRVDLHQFMGHGEGQPGLAAPPAPVRVTRRGGRFAQARSEVSSTTASRPSSSVSGAGRL